MLHIQIGKTILNFGFVIVDMQNGFVSKGGSYDRRGMGIRIPTSNPKRVRDYYVIIRHLHELEMIKILGQRKAKIRNIQ